MSGTASDQLRRLLHLLPEVADATPHRLDDLVARAGTDRKTLVADLRQLAERYDDPGGFVEGVRIYLGGEDVEVSSSHFLRPMRLTLSELRSLELGLAMLAQERPPEERAAIERARKRLRQAIAKLPDQDLECGWLESAAPTGVDLDTIAQLRKAIRERRVVRLNYQSGSATEPTWRDVHPLGLIFHSGMWYLVADGGGGVPVLPGGPGSRYTGSGHEVRSPGGIHPRRPDRGTEAVRIPGAGEVGCPL